MRIWSLHPSLLDTKGLVALWRETLLAKHVLEGLTKGYKFHPQLNRFKESTYPLDAIHYYLSEVYLEAQSRDFNFDKQKINWSFQKVRIKVTQGQVEYEKKHLLSKLAIRDPQKEAELNSMVKLKVHPMFKVVKGEIESWEILD
ncbi:MAG: pyrimidine dimer DNA glycosylase/endonuclease V [Chitinophagaceae bacterium]